MAGIELQPLPPAEAVRFFRAKGFAIGFAWQDVWQDEHARAFTVAKAMRLDILRDIREALDTAIAEGTTLKAFRDEITPILQTKGWWGRRQVVDPLTGETVLAQLGSPRRLKLIFDVNMRSSYAAGAWERAQRVKARRPFLRYVQLDRPSKREEHARWHDTVLPIDHPWWKTHYPPNGWNCGCRAMQLSARDLSRLNLKVAERAPPIRRVPFRNKRTGETIQIPKGIDPGFAHNVGLAASRRPVGGAFDLMIEKLERAPAGLSRAAVAELLRDPEFPGHLLGRFDGDFPLAVLPADLAARLGADATVVRLSAETAAKQVKHGLAPQDYRVAQAILDAPAAVRLEGPSVVLFGRAGGRLWRLVVKRTADGREAFLTSLHRSNEGQLRKARRR